MYLSNWAAIISAELSYVPESVPKQKSAIRIQDFVKLYQSLEGIDFTYPSCTQGAGMEQIVIQDCFTVSTLLRDYIYWLKAAILFISYILCATNKVTFYTSQYPLRT